MTRARPSVRLALAAALLGLAALVAACARPAGETAPPAGAAAAAGTAGGQGVAAATNPAAAHGGAPAGPTPPPAAPGPLPPNELGRVMILEYHAIGPAEGRWQRTPENLRRDLEALYRRGYRPVNANDLVNRRLDLPRGYSPVVLTFDDGSEGQFRFVVRDGRREVDPSSAVGVLLAFHREHPDWPLRATFYVNDLPFGQHDSWREKIRLLREWGMEVGNHTLTHANLAHLDAAGTAREIGGLEALLAQADPGLRTETLALPYGALPKAPDAARQGAYGGRAYAMKAFLLVGAGPAPSPYSAAFDPYRLPRIQAVDPALEPRANFASWLKYFDDHPEERYVSDGDPSRVTGRGGASRSPGAP